ncbi:toprim domain-containing protein [Mammaliicoccus vitulinus]|uniref:toprim domain-containing protein n=1 Tax=Mammaliicoccus vitulinus TaxID=71237 RepID=UPI003BA2C31E
MAMIKKVIIVEGISDKKRVEEVLNDRVHIICTHGTMGIEKMDELLEESYGSQVYVLVDQDKEGKRIRKWFKKYMSESHHIHIDSTFSEVARCPRHYLSNVLNYHGFTVKHDFVSKGKYRYHETHRNIERYIQAF